VCAIPQASWACAPSRARCPVLQRPGPLSSWFSPALVARRECAEPGEVALALGSILSGCLGLSPQVIKEASSPAAGGMEAPTSLVLPCKMDLDKVTVSNCPAEVLHGAAAIEPGEWEATELPVLHGGPFPSLQQVCRAYGATLALGGCASRTQEGQRADSGCHWGLHRGMLLTGCMLHSPCSGCHRRSTPPTRTAWRRVRPAPQQPAESPVSTVWHLSPARRALPPAGGAGCVHHSRRASSPSKGRCCDVHRGHTATLLSFQGKAKRAAWLT